MLDLGKLDDEVVWLIPCFCRNLASSLDEKGGPLLVKTLLVGSLLEDQIL